MSALLEVKGLEKSYATEKRKFKVLEETDSVTLLSAALKLLTKEPSSSTIELTEEAPLRSKNFRADPRDNRRAGGGSRGRGRYPKSKSGSHRNRANSRKP